MEPNEVCKNCASWNRFGHRCWFFWEGKKECSQFKEDDLTEPRYKNARIDPEQMLQDILDNK